MIVQNAIAWYIARDGDVVGPLPAVELAMLARSGRLRHSDSLWCAGMKAWVSAGEVAGLLSPAPPADQPGRTQPQNARRADPSPWPGRGAVPGVGGGGQKTEALTSLASLYRDRTLARRIAEVRTGSSEIAAHRASPQAAPRGVVAMAGRNAAIAAPTMVSAPPAPARQASVRQGARPATPAPAAAPAPAMADRRARSTAASKSSDRARVRAPLPFEAVTADIAATLLEALERQGVLRIEDLVTSDRLRLVVSSVHETLPDPVRLAVLATIGRPRLEDHLFDTLMTIKERWRAGDRTKELATMIAAVLGAGLRNELSHDAYRSVVRAPVPEQPKAPGGLASRLAQLWSRSMAGGRPAVDLAEG